MKAYEQGYEDFKRGNTENPYKEGSRNHKEWELGFNKAYFNNLESRRGSQEVHS